MAEPDERRRWIVSLTTNMNVEDADDAWLVETTVNEDGTVTRWHEVMSGEAKDEPDDHDPSA